MDFIINNSELSALTGLPDIQKLVYLMGLRPYMDVKTGLVGVKRRISYQSISEQLYVEPHPGIQSGRPSRDQLRRAVKGLDRAGLIDVQSDEKHLILKCHLASLGYSVQNKPATNPPSYATIDQPIEYIEKSIDYDEVSQEADRVESPKPAIPLKDNNYIYLLSQFEKFWSLYPEKKSKHKAQAAFEQLKPDTTLFQQLMQVLQTQINHVEAMQLRGIWVPPWKYPANWLVQRCWEDEISVDAVQETEHAKHTKNTRKRNTTGDLFCPPCDDDEPEGSNIIQFGKYLQGR